MGLKYDQSDTIPIPETVEHAPRTLKPVISASTSTPEYLRSPLGHSYISCAQILTNLADIPSLELLKPPSGPQLGDKILKFLKLRKKKSNSSAITTSLSPAEVAFQLSLKSYPFDDHVASNRFVAESDEDIRERYGYDSDENSGSVVSGASSDQCDARHNTSSAASASSSSRSSSSAQSIPSTPRVSFISPANKSHCQMMAMMLISISHSDEDNEASDEFSSEDDHHHPAGLDGPHESAWHQPLDEALAESLPRGRHTVSGRAIAKQSSGWNTLRHDRCSIEQRVESPGPSRRYGKLDLSKIEKARRWSETGFFYFFILSQFVIIVRWCVSTR